MELGTLKPNLPAPGKLRRRAAGGGFGNAGGKDDGGNGGGGSGPDGEAGELYEKSFSKSKIFTWFLLIVVLMTFGGLISAYVVIATNGVLEWRPFNLPPQVYFSTALILASSLTYTFAHRGVKADDHGRAKNLLLATTALGGMFISSQILVWMALVRRGYYMQSNPYAGFFYIMTALHAIHVLGGIIALGYVVLRCWRPTTNEKELEKRRDISGAVGWYWHFMGGLWLVLLFLLGFWK
ncbi:MAG: cytochrome c oxidase subunit 3 [Acidobacteria bacterium]|nr:cytochrome c oxidase subunit 3 [Acidobacteriota bacterium]